jgi:hypothetical protein
MPDPFLVTLCPRARALLLVDAAIPLALGRHVIVALGLLVICWGVVAGSSRIIGALGGSISGVAIPSLVVLRTVGRRSPLLLALGVVIIAFRGISALLLSLRRWTLWRWCPISLGRIVWAVVLRRIVRGWLVVAVFGSFCDLVDGVDTTAGENGSLDQSHD